MQQTPEQFQGFVTAKLQDIDRRLETIEHHRNGRPWLVYGTGTTGIGVVALIILQVLQAVN